MIGKFRWEDVKKMTQFYDRKVEMGRVKKMTQFYDRKAEMGNV